MVLEVHNMTRFKPNSIHVHMKQSCFMMDHVEKKCILTKTHRLNGSWILVLHFI